MKNSDLALALIVLAMTSALVDTAYAQDAAPAIAANGSQVTTHITQIVDLSLTVEIEAGSSVGENGDWWLVAETPSGWYSYDIHDRAWKPGFFVSYQGPLIDLPSFGVSSLNSGVVSDRSTHRDVYVLFWRRSSHERQLGYRTLVLPQCGGPCRRYLVTRTGRPLAVAAERHDRHLVCDPDVRH